jgi:hypothetical protein
MRFQSGLAPAGARWGAALPALAALMMCAPAPGAAAHSSHTAWSESKENSVQRTFSLAGPASGRSLTVDNFEGAVVVTGHPGTEVNLVVRQLYQGRSQEKLAAAEREVKLDVTQTGNHLELFVDGPFRSKNRDGGIDFNGWDRLGYEARFDFELQVPADLDVVLRTVNGGDVRVSGVHGRFEVANVNGAIEMTDVAGAGTARTVNGAVRVGFARNPAGNCAFHTINGKLDIGFKPGLAADLTFKTINGEVYSDFPYTYQPLPAAQAEHRQGKFVYRSHGGFAVRIAGGGPEMAFSTINGDILIRNQDL